MSIILLPRTAPGQTRPVNKSLASFDKRLRDWQSGVDPFRHLALGSAPVTVNGSGQITRTRSSHVVSANSGTSDELETINGGNEGDILALRAASGHSIRLLNGVGNIYLYSGSYTLNDSTTFFLIRRSSVWSGLNTGLSVDRQYLRLTRTTNENAIGSIEAYNTVTWETEVEDDGGWWDSGAPQDIVLPAGRYLITVQATFNTTASVLGSLGLRIANSSNLIFYGHDSNGDFPVTNQSDTISLAGIVPGGATYRILWYSRTNPTRFINAASVNVGSLD